MLKTRNPSTALQFAHTVDKRYPFVFSYTHPFERVVTLPSRPFNIAVALREALISILQVREGSEGFVWEDEMTLGLLMGSYGITLFHTEREIHALVSSPKTDMSEPGPFEAMALNALIIHEYVAAKFGMRMGTHTFSSSVVIPPKKRSSAPERSSTIHPVTRIVGADIERFEQEVAMLVSEGAKPIGFREKFIRQVAVPVLTVEAALLDNRPMDAFTYAKGCLAPDWEQALYNWIGEKMK